ncbi:MAG TPA: DISARM system SNF2-like helicase DrmD [Anaerolineae bacterium]|nr:DISARM system SNF2-like helicase DrmD [Anaerolineae bacterium]
MILSSPLPEQGQIVTVRQRQWVVTELMASALPRAPLPGALAAPTQHLVALSSIEDDALGETLQVIWEIEPGARVDEKVGLPEFGGFDSPPRFDAFLDAVAWGAVSSADHRTLQAPFRSGIEIEDYQLDPLVRAVQMPRVSLLIADDVGMGKTIEAGMVAQELITRHRARTVLVVCPAALQVQWREQMRDKFGLEFRIVDAESMKELRRARGIHVNPWTHFPRLITSIDFIKRDRPLRLIRELVPSGGLKYPRLFDILIVDEAHNVAPTGRAKYATDSHRTRALRTLTPHFEHKLFITATPHNGYKASFTALLELLDDQRFARGVEPDRAQLGAVMVRRMKSELKQTWDGKPRFHARTVQEIPVVYTEQEKSVHAWLKEYARSRQERVEANHDAQRYATEFVLKLLKKRLFSSPAAFRITLEQHLKTLSKKASDGATPKPTRGLLEQSFERIDEEYANDDEYEDSLNGAAETSTQLLSELTATERNLLQKMRTWAENSQARADSKARKLIEWLREIVKPKGVWSDERVIIFTEYRATQNWLLNLLVAEGLAGDDRLMMLYGGMETDKREHIKAAFQVHPSQSKVRILLATDTASEGIDLQNYCHRLVHYEIPWNPNRMEQRNGRLDRHGQKQDVEIFHFVSAGYQRVAVEEYAARELDADLEFLMRAVQKVEQIREDLGKVGPVIAQQVEEAMLGNRRRLDTSRAERENEGIKRMLKFERDVQKQITQQMEQLNETKRNLHLTPENIQTVVETALELAEQPALIPMEHNGTRAFELPAFRGSWQASAHGLAHPHSGELRPIVFDHDVARGRDDVVLAHLNHQLVQMSLRLLRAEVWSPSSKRGLHRVTARIVPNHLLDTPAVVGHARLVVIGGDSYRLHEEVIFAGGRLREGKFQRERSVSEIRVWLDAATNQEPSDAVKQTLLKMAPDLTPALLSALEARMRDRTEGLQKQLDARMDKDITDITFVMNELQRAIEEQLHEPEFLQLELPTLEEREQHQVNLDALQLRLKQIPNELEQEVEHIHARYANLQSRMFPIAVTFLVPQKLA